MADDNLHIAFGEVKGRLDIVIDQNREDRALLLKICDSIDKRVSVLEAHMATTKSTNGLVRWAGLAIASAVASVLGWFLQHFWSVLK
ncbi:hypothetical protein EOE18_15345 [Novosphingobium umbonatum]|uniref:Uncharacterized protein n=1 Tax=Novosphingobium umbonatum TaxID=1908524 RepID=A0A437N0Q1_9SPHN|nr:hypothetical protein [Novosphingobium umbonatum]RVU03496.1 hypothetical protein EOE18_15345 [Novosphingobium umbonatum]